MQIKTWIKQWLDMARYGWIWLNMGSVLNLVMVNISENLEIPDWFKELRVTAQEGSDHLPVIFRVE